MKRIKDIKTPIDALNVLIEGLGSQKNAADYLMITPSYLNDILHKRRDISENVATSLGFKKEVRFIKE